MSLASLFRFGSSNDRDDLIQEIFPFAVSCKDFVENDVVHIFTKILTDTFERTHGIPEENIPLLFDSAVQSNSAKGLVTLVATAMAQRSELFLVFKEGVIRKATPDEEAQIRVDYKKQAESALGVYISFKEYRTSWMVELYSGLEYLVIAALHKLMNLASAVQIKVSDLRGSVSLSDSSVAKAQAVTIGQGLVRGRPVVLDAKDIIETATPQVDSTNTSISFLASKRAFYLGLPKSYISGEQTTGIGSTGEGDAKAVDRGLRGYFYSVVKPICEALFGVKVTYKPNDLGQITSALEALRTFDLVGTDLMPLEAKQNIVARLFDLNDDQIRAQQNSQTDSAAVEGQAPRQQLPNRQQSGA